jgi:alkanesulfonate monooxygenase SsuD/methylene tetrahydromethanopterin reductase-like flavin-dependent oxidoreductase (luciferase family)
MNELRQLWDVSESLGFEWISIWDHFFASQIDPRQDCFEAVSCHAALAVSTSKVRVGSLVYCATYRHPAILANAAATIDHLSSGRLEFGIGAGWHEVEHTAYGFSFDPPKIRLRRLAEAVEVIRLLWTEEVVQYHGEFFNLTDAMCNPKPFQSTPRIWIGASGEKLGLPLVGRLADAWSAAYVSPEDLRRKLEIVIHHSLRPNQLVVGVNVGLLFTDGDPDDELRLRYGDAAERVKQGTLFGSVSQIVDKIGLYEQSGAQWLNIGVRAPFDLQQLERFMLEVVPQIAEPH